MELQNDTLLDLNIKWLPNNSSFASLSAMEELAQNCQNCNLCKTRNKVVVYDGNPKAKLMLIGEAPGEKEDLTGLPFVGRAGQLLNKILLAAEIDRQKETYICNIVKCRPPENRVPLPEEAKACLTYLEAQIAFIKPKIIILLGSTSLKWVLNIKNLKITKLHGHWIKGEQGLLKDILLMPFYHPSYLLRNSSADEGKPKWQALKAMEEVKNKLAEL